MRLLSTPERIRNFDIQPMSKQKNFSACRRIDIQNLLSMALFHHQHQIRPTKLLQGQLDRSMRLEIKPVGQQ